MMTDERIKIDMMTDERSARFETAKIAQYFLIEPYFDFFVNFNPSSNAPYHNRYHSFCVFCNVREGALYYRKHSIRGLLVGALFHDYNHTTGYQLDSINIERALEGLEAAHHYSTSSYTPLFKGDMALARRVIKITEYPYKNSPSTIEEKIIRDADLMQIYELNDEILLTQFMGLKQEINVKKPDLNLIDFANGNKSFQDRIVWYTDWAKKKAELLNFEAKKTHLRDLLLSRAS